MPPPGGGVDAACQTDALLMPSVPLPLQYPANLLWAQHMLAICMGQLQRVDLTVAQLRFYLREHELRAAAVAVLRSQKGLSGQIPVLGIPIVPGGAASVDVTPAAADDGAARAAPGGPQGVPAAGAEAAGAGAAAAVAGNLRMHRRRLNIAVRIAFVMWLLDVKNGWFFVYFFLAFLYIGGLFEPMVEWFQRGPGQQVTLEQQLEDLRSRQRRVAEQAERAAAAAAAARVAAAEAAALAEAVANDGVAGLGDAGSSADPAAAASPGAGGAAGDGSDSGAAAVHGDAAGAAGGVANAPEAEGGVGAADNAEADAEANRPPLAHRFIYQLVVMFFMTLLPWWNPDPRYL